MMQRVAWCSALIASTQAKIIAAPADTSAIIFYNLSTGKPNAKSTFKNASEAPAGSHLKWEIYNTSYIDEDSGY